MTKPRRLCWVEHTAGIVTGRTSSFHRSSWEDKLKEAGLKRIGQDDKSWIELAQDRDKWSSCVNEVMNFPAPDADRLIDCVCSDGSHAYAAGPCAHMESPWRRPPSIENSFDKTNYRSPNAHGKRASHATNICIIQALIYTQSCLPS